MKTNKTSNDMRKVVGLLIIIFSIAFLFLGLSVDINKQNNQSNGIPSNNTSPELLGTVWTLDSLENNSPVDNTSITVQFNQQGTITGFDGCNSFSGSYELSGSNLKINSPLASTRKACTPDVMSQADQFTKLLLATTSYEIKDSTLNLMQNSSAGLMFTGQMNPLTVHSWEVTGYNNGNQAVVSPIIDTSLTMDFKEDGTISGSAGCNNYSGTYTFSGETISVGTLAKTSKECIEPEGIMDQEDSFLAYLEKASTWSIQGDQLSLRTAEDSLAVTAITKN